MSTPPDPPQDPYDPFDPRYSERPPEEPGHRAPPPGSPAHPYHGGAGGTSEPPPGDPLVPADIAGWFGRVIGVVSRSLVPLLQIQLVLAVVGLVYFLVLGSAVEELAGVGLGSVAAADLGGMLGASLLEFLVLGAAGLFASAASVFLVVRHANSEPGTTLGEALVFAARRVVPLAGWSLLAALLVAAGFVVFIVPGVAFAIVVGASLTGVVVVERGGIGRCFSLIKGRFWPTAGRMLLAFASLLIYYAVVDALTASLSPGSVAKAVANIALGIPVGLVSVGVVVVTYAELRFRERPGVLTPTLAAELRR